MKDRTDFCYCCGLEVTPDYPHYEKMNPNVNHFPDGVYNDCRVVLEGYSVAIQSRPADRRRRHRRGSAPAAVVPIRVEREREGGGGGGGGCTGVGQCVAGAGAGGAGACVATGAGDEAKGKGKGGYNSSQWARCARKRKKHAHE